MYPVLELAKYIVAKCIKDNNPISNLQLQKILYYIQRKYLQELKTPAYSERIEAWPFGPVVPDVYYYFCGAGAMPIWICDEPDDEVIQSIPSKERQIIDGIIESKRLLNPWDMVADTHRQGGAWESVYDGGKGNRDIIPTDKIALLG